VAVIPTMVAMFSAAPDFDDPPARSRSPASASASVPTSVPAPAQDAGQSKNPAIDPAAAASGDPTATPTVTPAADFPAAPTSEAPVAADWAYTVSVRALCEFTAKRGDLDRRFTPSATALEGIQGQGTVAQRRGADYETEIALEGRCGPLRVRGRADGYDPRRRCLEEIKTLRGHPDDIPANRRQLHWAQLQTYGALFCRARGVAELALALVYFDVDSQAEVVLRQVFGAAELAQAFEQRCAQFLGWARQEALHRAARDAALAQLAFPPGAFRAGQRGLAEAVYRAAVGRRCLLAQAPTGIGKTVGTLFPLLRAMPGQAIDKIAYLTCKGTGRLAALEALAGLRAGTAGPPGPHLRAGQTDPQAADLRAGAAGRSGRSGPALRVVAMVAKDQACEHPDKACHGDACPLARGFYDRLPAARAEAVADGWLDAPAQRRIALRHGVCPYYLGQELVRWADVLVGDVHHLFDVNGALWGLMQALDWQLAVLVDEAHNLIERSRQMYSAELRLSQLRTAARQAPAALQAPLHALHQAGEALVSDTLGGDQPVGGQPASGHPVDGAAPSAVAERVRPAQAPPPPYAVLTAVPDPFTQALQTAAAALSEHFRRQPLAVGALLQFHFELQRFLRLIEALSAHSLFDIQTIAATATATATAATATASDTATDAASDTATDADTTDVDTTDAVFGVRNVAPACFLRQRFKALHSISLFSATLAPPDHAIRLLGLPEDTGWIDVPPAFAPEQLTVRVAAGLSTRYVDRPRSLRPLVDVIARQFDAHPGNYLAFFSSFDYLEQAAALLARRRPDLAQWRQGRGMGAAARQAFLARFTPAGQGIGFAVLGGVFAEGVDLPGPLLIGAFIATLGLPPVSALQDQVQARLEQLFGAGHGDADLVPAMHKVVQAAGRVLRSPDDRGWLWLLDERYGRNEVIRLLPAAWGLGRAPIDEAGASAHAAAR
jgi:DNA excision repair protein ERCC-2